MSMSDPIGDFVIRIKNACLARKEVISLPSSSMKLHLVDLLKREGYISDYKVDRSASRSELVIFLKYYNDMSVIESIRRISTPGLRVYKGKRALPLVRDGLGIAIISTSKGLMTDKEARKAGEGGEVIAFVA
ncbi:30S ribosomal subunit protein S8 [Gammaproteobacteria bacterium]